MASPPPPDPYLALGVPKDATAAVIKSQYRKLVLKFHPDKVQDESQKQAAADQFHRVQTAYEIIGDEDKRARYDAQCKLAELRKDVMDKQGGRRDVNTRSPAFKAPSEAPREAARGGGAFYTRGAERTERVSPLYEERTPSYQTAYASNDYFESQPKSTARREPEYERSAKRATPNDSRDRAKPSAKEAERVRQQERHRRADKDLRQDRDRKAAYVEDVDSDSDLAGYESHTRRMRQEEEQRRVRTPQHDVPPSRARETAARGFYDCEERAHKSTSQYDAAQDYIGRTTRERERPRSDSERRPSPVRKTSSKEKMEYVNVRRKDGRPSIAPRRDSERPKAAVRDADMRRTTLRDSERRSSVEIVDEPARRPPGLQQSKSSPPVIPAPFEKQRPNSLHVDRDDLQPKMKRSETMPMHSSSRERDPRRRGTEPQKSSGLRQTEIVDGLPPTPAATPEWTAPKENKYKYNQEYADDHEIPTPDGYKVNDTYKTEVREPTAAPSRRYTRSPSPLRRDDKPRAASARYPSPALTRPGQPPRTTSTTYVYTPGGGVESHARPGMARENSIRNADMLYGEVRGARSSPRPTTQSRYSPPEESARYQKDAGPENIRVQSGYGSRRPSAVTRPSYSRSGSSAPISTR